MLANTEAAGKYLGWQLRKYSQTKQDKVDYHGYLSGKKVMKAVNGNDLKFYDKNGQRIHLKPGSNLKNVHSLVITFRHQKNCQNGQQIRLMVNKDHPKICAVINLAEMVLRKIRLGHSMDLSLAIYANKKGEVKYLTSAKMTEMIRKAVRTVYSDMPKEEVMKYSTHSIRVWACVSPDEAGKSPDFIKKRLR